MIAAVAGGTAGGVLVIAAIVGFICYRRRKSQRSAIAAHDAPAQPPPHPPGSTGEMRSVPEEDVEPLRSLDVFSADPMFKIPTGISEGHDNLCITLEDEDTYMTAM